MSAKPYIDASGYHYPTYQEILEDMVTQIQSVCGQDVYLGSDSMDYQIISIFALKVFDCYQAVEIAYNSHSPVTAIGTALDYIVALNGITRTQGTKSEAVLTLTGTPRTKINGGIVSDTNGVLWDLPKEVEIGENGTVSVKATCRNTGITIAEAHTITNIMSPTLGWVSVDNPSQAVTGTVVESDSALRARQALAVAAPSQSILNGLKAALLEVTDVTRVEVIENDTDETKNGIPEHSICCIVDGGTSETSGGVTTWSNDTEIAQTILAHKSMGCGTYGQRTVNIVDNNVTYPIKYSRPQGVEILIKVKIKLLDNSYTEEYYTKTIRTEIVKYISTYTIGKSFVPSMLWGVVQAINEDATNPSFSISEIGAKKKGTANQYSLDPISMNYYEYAFSNIGITEADQDITVEFING